MRQHLRCGVLEKMPGVQGELIQCVNPATTLEHIDGCGCDIPDWEVCLEGFDVPVCNGPHNFGQ